MLMSPTAETLCTMGWLLIKCVTKRLAGWTFSGGGLALYDSNGTLLGTIGVSGDSSCPDHNIAWLTRNNLGLDYVPAGVSGDPARPDNIVYDIFDSADSNPESADGLATRIALTQPPKMRLGALFRRSPS